MNPTELPSELQYEILLDWSYNEIMNYCKVNTAATELCRSNAFWSLKAERDYAQPLSIIVASTPALQYKILSEIFSSENPAAEAIIFDQPQLFTMFNWNPQAAAKNPDVQENLAKELGQGNWSMFRWLENRLPVKALKQLHTDVYIYAIYDNADWNVAAELSFVNYVKAYNQISELSKDDAERNVYLKFVIDDAIAHGDQDIAYRAVDSILQCSIDNEIVCDADIFSYILNTYVDEDTLNAIFNDVFEQPIMPYLMKQHMKQIHKWLGL